MSVSGVRPIVSEYHILWDALHFMPKNSRS